MVVIQHLAKPCMTVDLPFPEKKITRSDRPLVAEPLMRPFFVIVRHVLIDRVPEMLFPEEDHPVKTF